MSRAVVIDDVRAEVYARSAADAKVVLLGCGNVGSAVTRLLAREEGRGASLRITAALVRDPERSRDVEGTPRLTADPAAALRDRPDVVIELLGGLEPARELVLRALRAGIPVVTANKTLLAHHGAELHDAARRSSAPLLYEAAVLAGVPFLGTFARRPLARTVTSLCGIANGTSNFILTRCSGSGARIADALAEAQRLGYAEPDPGKDLSGADAAEKLAVLLHHFAGVLVSPDDIDTSGIERISAAQIAHARTLGGVIKPLVHADWASRLEACVAPVFLPATHVLARVDDEENALLLDTSRGRLLFQGPGAGPEVTAATVLDDVHEILAGTAAAAPEAPRPARPDVPRSGWLITLEGHRLPTGPEVADFLGSHSVYICRATERDVVDGVARRSYLTWPAPTDAIDAALPRLASASGCAVSSIRAFGGAA